MVIQVIQIPLKWSNAYLLLGDRAVLIDSGSPGEEHQIERLLLKHNVSFTDLSLIILTHGHGDHAGSVSAIKKRCKVPVAIHKNDCELITSGKDGLLIPYGLLGKIIRPFFASPYDPTVPDIIIEEEFDLSPFGVAARTIHTPGHTGGSISIICERHAIVGDSMMGGFTNGLFGAHRPSYPFFVNDMAHLQDSIGKILSIAPEILYVGHGGPLKIEKVRTKFAALAA